MWSAQVVKGQVFWLREPINHLDGVSIMANYPENQKRYNAFEDEWDVCTEFNPADILEFDWDEDETPLPEREGYKVPSTSSILELPSSFQPNVFVGNEVPTSVLPSPPPLDDILYQRYGFLCSTEPIPPDSTVSLNHMAKVVCEGAAPVSSSSSERNAMRYFLNLLIGAKSIPCSLCDLRDGSLLEQYNQGMITVERRQGRYYSHSGPVYKKYYLI